MNLLFSQRAKLDKLFMEWAQANNADRSSFNVITWMQAENLLDINAIKNYIEMHGSRVTL